MMFNHPKPLWRLWLELWAHEHPAWQFWLGYGLFAGLIGVQFFWPGHMKYILLVSSGCLWLSVGVDIFRRLLKKRD